jgi:hypothetical protein
MREKINLLELYRNNNVLTCDHKMWRSLEVIYFEI